MKISQTKYSKGHSQAGFTLIELIVVTLFLSIIGVSTWTYLRTTMNTQKAIEDKTSFQQLGLSVMERFQDDISQVFYVESYQKLTFFRGKIHDLTFSTLSHDSPNPEDRESEEAEITYSMEADPEDTENQTQLILRKEVGFLDGEQEKNEDYKPLVVSKQVSNLEFAYSADGIKYSDEWDVAATDHAHTLPKLIKIKLTLKNNNQHEEYFETLIDLPMTEDLNVTNAKSASQNPTPTPGTSGSSSPQTSKLPRANPQGQPNATP